MVQPEEQGPVNIAEVQRALTFVKYTDELIWRRSAHGSSHGPAGAIFDPANMTALKERLSLWEGIMRR